jgi:hypothetical protein
MFSTFREDLFYYTVEWHKLREKHNDVFLIENRYVWLVSVLHAKDPEIGNEENPPPMEGLFGWTLIDDTYIPYIFRADNKKYVCVRLLVELKLVFLMNSDVISVVFVRYV